MNYATDYPKLKRPNLLLRWKETQEAYLLYLHDHHFYFRVQEVGEKRVAAVFYTVMIVQVEQVGFLCLLSQ